MKPRHFRICTILPLEPFICAVYGPITVESIILFQNELDCLSVDIMEASEKQQDLIVKASYTEAETQYNAAGVPYILDDYWDFTVIKKVPWCYKENNDEQHWNLFEPL